MTTTSTDYNPTDTQADIASKIGLSWQLKLRTCPIQKRGADFAVAQGQVMKELNYVAVVRAWFPNNYNVANYGYQRSGLLLDNVARGVSLSDKGDDPENLGGFLGTGIQPCQGHSLAAGQEE